MADATRHIIIQIQVNEKHLEILRDMQTVLETNEEITPTVKKLINICKKNQAFLEEMHDEAYLLAGMSDFGPYFAPTPIGAYLVSKDPRKHLVKESKVVMPDFRI